MEERGESDLTAYLHALGRGERPDAGPEELLASELRAIAEAYLGRARGGATLQPTVLVNEAYLKLFQRTRAGWRDRGHFFAVAARAMRQLLVDRARARGAEKRGGARERITLDEERAGAPTPEVDLLDLDEALGELAQRDERAARVVELRYFAGLEMEEVALALELSLSTVEREWRTARAWLAVRLKAGEQP